MKANKNPEIVAATRVPDAEIYAIARRGDTALDGIAQLDYQRGVDLPTPSRVTFLS